jgi:hypothetical protein
MKVSDFAYPFFIHDNWDVSSIFVGIAVKIGSDHAGLRPSDNIIWPPNDNASRRAPRAAGCGIG